MTADVRVCPSCQSSFTPTGAGQKFCRKLCKRFNYQLRRYGRETAETWRAHKIAQMRTPVVVRQVTPTREQIAEILKASSLKWGGPSLKEFENDPPTRKHYAQADAVLALMQNQPKGD